VVLSRKGVVVFGGMYIPWIRYNMEVRNGTTTTTPVVVVVIIQNCLEVQTIIDSVNESPSTNDDDENKNYDRNFNSNIVNEETKTS
jgi:hypothetical protein